MAQIGTRNDQTFADANEAEMPYFTNDNLAQPMLRQAIALKGMLNQLVERIGFWIQRSKQRSALAEMDDERLRDLGLCQADVTRECAKRFWR